MGKPKGIDSVQGRWELNQKLGPIPKEAVGSCKNAVYCNQWNVVLGDGYCTFCWDVKTDGISVRKLWKGERRGRPLGRGKSKLGRAK